MNKIFWYFYFIIYMITVSILGRIRITYLNTVSREKAEDYAFKTMRGISAHVMTKSKTSVDLSGLENLPEGPCVFVANHQAIFDAFLLFYKIDKKMVFVAKKEIIKIPLIGWWMRQGQTVFIDRKNLREGAKAIDEAVEKMKKGYSVIIFPEGTRSLSSEIGTFKKGSMKLAVKANVPIIPLTIDGTYNVLETGRKVRGHRLRLTIHKPIYVNQLTEQEKKNLSEIVRGIISEGLKK
jgi:1-acyl-sn-glycerol-3-phosphate acyltransferase